MAGSHTATGRHQIFLSGPDLRARRNALGLSQSALGARLGIAANTIARWERGERPISSPELLALALERLEASSPTADNPVSAQLSDAHERMADRLDGNLPVSLSSFIGRADALRSLQQMLGATRLLTLIGPAGIGKTRLAIEVARANVAHTEQSAYWVEIAPVTRSEDVARAVADALGVRERRDFAPMDAIAQAIGRGRRLLVIDNCEHLISACADLAEQLLRRCPDLQLLATSREPLGVAGETTWLVPAMTVPEAQATMHLSELAETEAIQLFVARAAARGPFALTTANAPHIVEICRRLDGVPLALELAAARVSALGLEQLRTKLDDRFRVLMRPNGTGSLRQQTLWAAVDWSYNLLTESERFLFERVAIFSGGFTLEAAEAVTCEEIDTSDVVNVLTRLIDKSMVAVDPLSSGAVRYRLLETMREFGQQRLESRNSINDARTSHARYFAGLAERAAPALWGTDEQTWLTQLDLEHENLRAAIDWCAETDANLALRLVSSLWGFWLLRGLLVEGDRRMQRVLSRAPTQHAARAVTLLRASPLPLRMAVQQRARSWISESYSTFRQMGDRAGQVQALHDLAVLDTLQLKYTNAIAGCEEACELASDAGLAAEYAAVTHSLGAIHYLCGDFAGARRLMEEALTRADALEQSTPMLPTLLNIGCWMPTQAVGPIRLAWEDTLALFRNLTVASARAYFLANLGSLARASRDTNRARMLLHESLVSFQRTGDRHGGAHALAQLGNLAARTGDYERARHHLDESLAIRRSLGDGRGVGLALLGLARLAIDEGAARIAKARYAEGLAHFRAMGDAAGTCSVLEDLSDLALHDGELDRAEHLLRESLDIRQRLGADWAFVHDGMLGPGFSHQLIASARAVLPDVPQALEMFFRELVDLRERWAGRAGLALLFEDLASATAARGDHARAARLFGYATTLDGRRPASDTFAGVQPQISSDDWERGRMFSVEQALAHALCAPAVSVVRAESPTRNSRPAGLTDRETEVLGLVARGMTNHEIGLQLVVSERTVAKHLDNAFRKIGVRSRAGATAFAIRAGIA